MAAANGLKQTLSVKSGKLKWEKREIESQHAYHREPAAPMRISDVGMVLQKRRRLR